MAKNRGWGGSESLREFEEIDKDYLLTMKMVSRGWLEGAKSYVDALVVDTDDFDFSSNDGDREKLVEMVVERLWG